MAKEIGDIDMCPWCKTKSMVVGKEVPTNAYTGRCSNKECSVYGKLMFGPPLDINGDIK